ncbi:DNA polymerase III subunit delta [Flaviaesturariibacter amylovorans]|uniref:DNA polymerase III subunit delta n=1 Tax=Flaviaesturariibacter amylovorans TaxID=1084520 RepID=A0ABP8GST2_9BACT
MSAQKIIGELKKGLYKPVYWLEGEEEYFIDQVMDYAEHHILSESEAGFNKTVFYGRDADWASVINACRRYPMFAERQVVLLREAQSMRDIEKLEAYIEKPLPSTLLFVAYKGKKVDGRTKLAKILKEKSVLYTTKKLYEKDLPEWTQEVVKAAGFTIEPKALHLLIDHIGNDLSRIYNEVQKMTLNLAGRKTITPDDIEQFVGISKEYNVFELQDALARRDYYKAMRIVNYFDHNPKAAPLPLVFPSLYGFFSKLQVVHSAPPGQEKALAASIGINEWKLKDYVQAAKQYAPHTVEKNLLLLHQYNLKSVGVDDAGSGDGELLKELVVKMIMD